MDPMMLFKTIVNEEIVYLEPERINLDLGNTVEERTIVQHGKPQVITLDIEPEVHEVIVEKTLEPERIVLDLPSPDVEVVEHVI